MVFISAPFLFCRTLFGILSIGQEAIQLPPMKVGQKRVVEVSDVGHAGDGVARYRNYVLFIPGAAAGDEAEVEITEVGRSHGRAHILDLVRRSPERTDPRCVYYGFCGGCQLQHLSYEAELRYKRLWVQQAASRIGGVEDSVVEPVLSVGSPYNYRERSRFAIQSGFDGNTRIGFRERRSNRVVDISECDIQVSRNNRILERIRQWMLRDGQGLLSDDDQLMIRSAQEDAILIHITDDSGGIGTESAQHLLAQNPELTGVVQQTGERTVTLAGRDQLTFCFNGLEIVASALAFTQVNRTGADILYQQVIEGAEFVEDDVVIELFSGVGVLTLQMASHVDSVFSVDLDPAAVRNARCNAARNDMANTTHYQGDAAEGLRELIASGCSPTVLVMDPPRAGCSPELLNEVANLDVRRIMYVSCDFGTWARDVRHLVGGGWKMHRVVPVDMFPQTANVEIVSVLDPEGG